MAFFWSQLNCHNFKRADPKDSPTVTNYISSPFTLCLCLHPGLFTICNYAFVLFLVNARLPTHSHKAQEDTILVASAHCWIPRAPDSAQGICIPSTQILLN